MENWNFTPKYFPYLFNHRISLGILKAENLTAQCHLVLGGSEPYSYNVSLTFGGSEPYPYTVLLAH